MALFVQKILIGAAAVQVWEVHGVNVRGEVEQVAGHGRRLSESADGIWPERCAAKRQAAFSCQEKMHQYGSDIAKYSNVDFDECTKLCCGNVNCAGFNWRNPSGDDKNCFLKDDMKAPTDYDDYEGSAMHCVFRDLCMPLRRRHELIGRKSSMGTMSLQDCVAGCGQSVARVGPQGDGRMEECYGVEFGESMDDPNNTERPCYHLMEKPITRPDFQENTQRSVWSKNACQRLAYDYNIWPMPTWGLEEFQPGNCIGRCGTERLKDTQNKNTHKYKYTAADYSSATWDNSQCCPGFVLGGDPEYKYCFPDTRPGSIYLPDGPKCSQADQLCFDSQKTTALQCLPDDRCQSWNIQSGMTCDLGGQTGLTTDNFDGQADGAEACKKLCDTDPKCTVSLFRESDGGCWNAPKCNSDVFADAALQMSEKREVECLSGDSACTGKNDGIPCDYSSNAGSYDQTGKVCFDGKCIQPTLLSTPDGGACDSSSVFATNSNCAHAFNAIDDNDMDTLEFAFKTSQPDGGRGWVEWTFKQDVVVTGMSWQHRWTPKNNHLKRDFEEQKVRVVTLEFYDEREVTLAQVTMNLDQYDARESAPLGPHSPKQRFNFIGNGSLSSLPPKTRRVRAYITRLFCKGFDTGLYDDWPRASNCFDNPIFCSNKKLKNDELECSGSEHAGARSIEFWGKVA